MTPSRFPIVDQHENAWKHAGDILVCLITLQEDVSDGVSVFRSARRQNESILLDLPRGDNWNGEDGGKERDE